MSDESGRARHFSTTAAVKSVRTIAFNPSAVPEPPEPEKKADYIRTNILRAGKEYLIVDGNTGDVNIVSREAACAVTLSGECCYD